MKDTLNNTKVIAILLVLVLVVLSGCTSNPVETPQNNGDVEESLNYPLEITDDTGNTITINKKPERIISLAPSHTEILYALGLGDEVVGVTQYCDYPEEALDKPKVGDSFNVDMEKIIELSPELVIQYWEISDEFKSQLQSAGIKLLAFEPESIAETIETIKKIGLATGTSEEANQLTSNMEKRKNEIVSKLKDAPVKKVFYEIEYSSDLWTVGEGSFINELITLVGGENIAKDAEGNYAQYSIEAVIEKNPEVYVTNTFNMNLQSYTDIKDRPGFESIDAVKNENVQVLDGNLLSRPSQRVVDALELMAKAIHPELFK